MRRLIFNADDLGVCESTNFAIARAHSEGVLTSASLMATGPAFEHAVANVVKTHPRLRIGLHLALTLGRSVLPPAQLPALVDASGRFRLGFAGVWRLATFGGATARRQISAELDAQFRRAADAGVKLRHVDGHRHFHMIPPIFAIVAELAAKYRCPAIRVSSEPFPNLWSTLQGGRLTTLLRNLPKQILLAHWAQRNQRGARGLTTADRVYGIIDSGCMDAGAIKRIVETSTSGVSEVITHPGAGVPADFDVAIPPVDQVFLASANRRIELEALTDSSVINCLRAHSSETADASLQEDPDGSGAFDTDRHARCHDHR